MISSQSKGKYGPGKDIYVEMGRKTTIRRLAKYLPLSIEFQKATALDGLAERGQDQQLNTFEGEFVNMSDESAPYVNNTSSEEYEHRIAQAGAVDELQFLLEEITGTNHINANELSKLIETRAQEIVAQQQAEQQQAEQKATVPAETKTSRRTSTKANNKAPAEQVSEQAANPDQPSDAHLFADQVESTPAPAPAPAPAPSPRQPTPEEKTAELIRRAGIAQTVVEAQALEKYMNGLSIQQSVDVRNAINKRVVALQKPVEASPAEPEKKSLMVRMKEETDPEELNILASEIEMSDPAIQPQLREIYDARMDELMR
jgi:hypothetical protein